MARFALTKGGKAATKACYRHTPGELTGYAIE